MLRKYGLKSFSLVRATTLSNHPRAWSLWPFCQRATAWKTKTDGSMKFCNAIDRSLASSDSVQCPRRYSASASVLKYVPAGAVFCLAWVVARQFRRADVAQALAYVRAATLAALNPFRTNPSR
jgi:hypothetical protein